ncbi:MAG: hypothetical protein JW754_03180 [Candidatus Aenigmarchaeota archaeon]|nr:hypothetical protein [Candidatus Aenigmarchaeota archaeon]
MNGNGVKHREVIIGLLKDHPEGLTITSIASLSGLHRHTVTRYIYELHGADVVVERVIGPAKLFYLKKGLSESQKNNIMGRLNGMKKSSLGQMQILAVLLFLFLVPTTIIIAQNATNYTNFTFVISGGLAATNGGVTGEINFSDLLLNITNVTNGTGINDSNETRWDESEGGNYTIPVNESYDWNDTQDNTTIPENQTLPSNDTNDTTPNETLVIPEPPVLEVAIDSPDKVTRGETFQATGRVISRGLLPVHDVRIEWNLPDGFEIVSGERFFECGDLSKDEECVSAIELSTIIDTRIGKEELEVLVYYE